MAVQKQSWGRVFDVPSGRRQAPVRHQTADSLSRLLGGSVTGRTAPRPSASGSRGTSAPLDGWHGAMASGGGPRNPSAAPRAQQSNGLDSLMEMLFGAAGGLDQSAAIGQSYDAQIGAYNNMGAELGRLTNQLVGNIRGSADATNQQIGGFFGYAADQANAGRPAIADTYDTAAGNVDALYDNLASQLAGIPQTAVDQASAAAGSAVGGSVAGRVAAATAPFAAAGETSRANTQANLTQHSAAGQTYLSQLAAAAPSEAALAQSSVSGRANNAVTEAEMALAQQRAQIAAQTAALEGAKQRAIAEHTADVAGNTFNRIMQTAQLYNALDGDAGQIRDALGIPAAPQQMQGQSYEDMLDIGIKEMRLGDMQRKAATPERGVPSFQAELANSSPSAQQLGMQLLDLIDENELSQADALQLVAQLTNEGPERGRFGGTRNGTYVDNLAELLANPDATMWTAIDPGILRGAVRSLFR